MQFCQEFLALFGSLSSSASIQLIFCVNHFTCRCVFFFFYVFVGEGEHVLLLSHHLARPLKCYKIISNLVAKAPSSTLQRHRAS